METSLVTGAELDRMDEAEFTQKLPSIKIYARVNPEHKMKVVRAWRERGGHYRHDRRRGKRRTGFKRGRHRYCNGYNRHRRYYRSSRHGAHRRQLRYNHFGN